MTPNTTPKAGKKQSPRPSKSAAASTDTPRAPEAESSASSAQAEAQTAVASTPQPAQRSLIGRIPVTEVFPVVEDGRWPAKAVVGEVIPVRATVFREGHDRYGATAVLVRPDGSDGPSARMHDIAPGLDRYEASLAPDAPGDWRFRVEGWSDPYATWSHDAGIKVPAGIDVELMLEEGARVLDRAAAIEGRDEEGIKALNDAVWIMRDPSNPVGDRLAAGLADSV
ncbi:maltotransferase domain-containing protein, partial [Actinomyces naeslundii]